MTKEDNIIVPRWFLEVVEDMLRIQNNINLDKNTGETCQDRNIRQSLNGVRKLLKGEELTGMERFEKLQPSLPSNLDEAAEEYAYINWQSEDYHEGASEGLPFDAIGHTANCFKAGAEWMAEQGHTVDGTFHHSCGYPSVIELKTYLRDYEGADVIVQIRKKQ